jgi:hypothetical protein
MVDFDEFGVTLEKCNHTGGWAVAVHHVRKDRHYHHGIKMTVIFAIKLGDLALPAHVRGSVEHPWRWIRCLCAVGTTTNIFRDFCNYDCTDIEMNNISGTDFHQVFIWDNLTAHHSAYVHNTVTNRIGPSNFSIVPRPQYHPKYGPIEYKICKVMEKMCVFLASGYEWVTVMHEIPISSAQTMTSLPYPRTQ